ncbi:polysaccharide deacetylase family protein [Defluviicoccus vanus]|uniref:Chitooligosaccharide deacetylase n=1 Tax=Defluviicoccus vanus TaxID=111831 RepID=A0A7H1N143_9PROT|nr:polysaccharide deacetylase family protein [Defluviicoccus vanus]
MKVLSMSYDDGSEHDRRLVGLFDAYGLRGTFHLISSTLGQDYRVGRDEVARLYRRHEVACHGATHANLGSTAEPAPLRDPRGIRKAAARPSLRPRSRQTPWRRPGRPRPQTPHLRQHPRRLRNPLDRTANGGLMVATALWGLIAPHPTGGSYAR